MFNFGAEKNEYPQNLRKCVLKLHIWDSACWCTNDIIQGVPGGKDLTSGECSLGQTIPI